MLWNDFMKFRTWLYAIIIEKYSGNRLFTKKFVYVELEITNQINISINKKFNI